MLQQAERVNAGRLILVGSTELARGCVRVKDLSSRQEADVPLEQLYADAEHTASGTTARHPES